MTKKQLKHKAQDDIMHNAMNSWRQLKEYGRFNGASEELVEYEKIMRHELARIEKLFGIIPMSSK
jgi:hypothetical protein